MDDKLEIILNACKRVYGSDFTEMSRKRMNVYARACFYTIARDMTDKSFAKIGGACGGRNHATVLHVTSGKAGYELVPEFRKMLDEFKTEVRSLSILWTETEKKEYKDDLESQIENLKLENKKLLNQIYNIPATEVFKMLSHLPKSLLEDFKQTRLIPYLNINRLRIERLNNLDVEFEELLTN